MRSVAKWMVPVIVVGLLGWFGQSLVQAADASTHGTIKGTVVDKEHKAASDVKVEIFKANEATGDSTRHHPRPAAEATTNDKGEFSASVPAGEYVLVARHKGEGVDRERVTVVAGETAKVSLSLHEKAAAPK